MTCRPSVGGMPGDSFSGEDPPQWVQWIREFDLGSNMIIVQKGSSIQDALDVADPGDVIYIEPGIYREAPVITQSDIQIIGLPGADDETVILENPGRRDNGFERAEGIQNVQIFHIQFSGFKDPGMRILPLGSSQMKRGMALNMKREELGEGIAHYSFEVDVSDEIYDRIRIHRVVRERKPYVPMSTRGNVFMVHAAIQDFEDIYLRVGAEVINEETSSPFFLASNKIDVWAIDLAWTLLPMETADFSFMKGWGIERDVDHTLTGMTVARLIRGMTGQGFDRMNLLGYCCTANLVYTAAGRETQMKPVLHNISGLIPVEGLMKYEPVPENEPWRQNNCTTAADLKARMDAGTFNFEEGMGMIHMASLALSAPEEISPVPPFDGMGVTNYQAFLMAGFSPAENPDAPSWHYFGGTMDDGFLYADPNRFIRLGVNLNPHMPVQHLYEACACACNEEEVSMDDHLGEIRLPILYLGAEGGLGSYGVYTGSLTASGDITHHIVRKGVDRALEYGHADIWMGYDAAELVWEPLSKWLMNH